MDWAEKCSESSNYFYTIQKYVKSQTFQQSNEREETTQSFEEFCYIKFAEMPDEIVQRNVALLISYICQPFPVISRSKIIHTSNNFLSLS